MSNHYFQFKQFTIQQDKAAMKVTTDACIFGAAVAQHFISHDNDPKYILDIGAGTGLLSIMLAQTSGAMITAVEIDDAAFEQASVNFKQSPWAERLSVQHIDALNLDDHLKFDCIISNPPFFEADLKSPDGKKNHAKHDTGLTLSALLSVVDKHLTHDGSFAVLLPMHRLEECILLAATHHLSLNKKILLKHTDQHPIFRGILFFRRTEISVNINTLVIKDEQGNYTTGFVDLLKDYYLYL